MYTLSGMRKGNACNSCEHPSCPLGYGKLDAY